MEAVATINAVTINVHLHVVPCIFVYEKGNHRHQVVCVTREEKRERRSVMISGPLAWSGVLDKFNQYRRRFNA